MTTQPYWRVIVYRPWPELGYCDRYETKAERYDVFRTLLGTFMAQDAGAEIGITILPVTP